VYVLTRVCMCVYQLLGVCTVCLVCVCTSCYAEGAVVHQP
jgi:hypothetical protein